MMNNNKKDFTALMYGLFATYDKVFNQTQVDIYWNVLSKYSFEQLDHAINQHLLTAKYFPRPAEIIELIDSTSGNAHMDSSEAWAIALSANDESNTVVWTDEMHKAWTISKNVMDIGDEVGARRAFIEAYERLVRESVIQGKKINVTVSIGFDKSKRTEAINRAMFTGLLSSHEGQKYLPKPENTFAMLENKTAVPKAKGIPQSLLKIKAQIQAQKEQSKSQWEIEKNHLHDSLKERYEQQKQALEGGIANV